MGGFIFRAIDKCHAFFSRDEKRKKIKMDPRVRGYLSKIETIPATSTIIVHTARGLYLITP